MRISAIFINELPEASINIQAAMSEIKIFVADDVKESGLEPLRAAGFAVTKRTGLKGDELVEAMRDSDGLIVRSETKVTTALMDATARLRVIGRAGVGVDNIDVAGATTRGIVVMNAPDGNTITTAGAHHRAAGCSRPSRAPGQREPQGRALGAETFRLGRSCRERRSASSVWGASGASSRKGRAASA